MVMGLPERLASTVAPARAAGEEGGIGTHTSSQTSACSVSPGTSTASNSRSVPNGTVSPATAMCWPAVSSPRAYQRCS